MSWTAPRTWIAGETLTASLFNTHIRDNMLETEGAKATGAGYFVGAGVNSIVERKIQYSVATGSVNTASNVYVSLGSSTPKITATTSDRCLVIWSANMSNNTANASIWTSIDVSGATTIASTDNNATTGADLNINADRQYMRHKLFNTLTAGSNAFTMQYRVGAGTGTYTDRRMFVVPF